jgi:hypothetical protein
VSEIYPVSTGQIRLSNDQCHDAAITIAEYCDYLPETTAYYLDVIGLADRDEYGVLHSVGTDEYEIPWFTPASGGS